MNHRRLLWLLLLPLLPLALGLALPPARRAAAQTGNDLRAAFAPPAIAAGQPVTLTLKNFSWDRVARFTTVALTNTVDGDEATVGQNYKLGPRRRGSLAAPELGAGLWQLDTSAEWLFGLTVLEIPAALLVATPGSTAGALAFDAPVEGVVVPADAGGSRNGWGAWSFDLAEETAVTLQARPTAGNAPELELFDATGNDLFSADALIANLTLPAGRYLLAVVAEEETAYTLSLSTGPSGDSDGGPLTPGTLALGLLSPADDVDEFTFAGAPGDVVYAALRASDAGLDPALALLDPVGNVVAANDDSQGSEAALAYVVPVAGQYTLRLTSSAGGSQGAYTLEFQHDPEMTRLRPPTALGIGQQANGRLQQGAQAWRVAGAAGAALGVRVQSQTADFDAHLTVFGPDGAPLAFSDDDGGALNPLLNLTLPADGYYTLVVGSYTGAAGDYLIATAAQPFATPSP